MFSSSPLAVVLGRNYPPSLCILPSSFFPSAVDLVRMTVCMTRLLVKEKLKQFSDLCFRAKVRAVWVEGRRGDRY